VPRKKGKKIRMSDKKNILFLLSDEHSFRCMGHVSEENGGENVFTPNLDELAGHGTVFSNTYCQVALCTPSRISLFTGKDQAYSGAWTNESYLRPELPNIAETLKDNNYVTCLVGKYHLGGSNQFGGFEYRPYGDLTGKCGHQWEPLTEPYTMRQRTAAAGTSDIPESLMQENMVNNETLAFLREHKNSSDNRPYFLCASYSRPHFPLNAPKRFVDMYDPKKISEPMSPASGDAYGHPMSVGMRKGFAADKIDHDEMMNARSGYFANVSYMDELIGDLLVRMEKDGLLDNTIIIYSSDHGEMAGEHGVWWKNGWYEACSRVPFIISTPEQRRGEQPAAQVDSLVGLYDLFPTLCGLTGTDIPAGLHGIDLSGAIKGDGVVPDDRPVFSDGLVPRWGEGTEYRMIRLGNYKYVTFRNAEPLMFDVVKDPGEQHNIVDSNDSVVVEFRAKFESIVEETVDFEKSDAMRSADEEEKRLHPLKVKDELKYTNLYILSDGRVITADDELYRTTVAAENYKDVFQI
jgi:choline-sulfatase